MNDLNKRVGHVIRKIREQKGLTQEQFAEASGIHDKHIGRIERGTHGITLEYLIKVSTGLNVSVPDLINAIFETEKATEEKQKIIQDVVTILKTQPVGNLKFMRRLCSQFYVVECHEPSAPVIKRKKAQK